jgi:hypothetical protein
MKSKFFQKSQNWPKLAKNAKIGQKNQNWPKKPNFSKKAKKAKIIQNLAFLSNFGIFEFLWLFLKI